MAVGGLFLPLLLIAVGALSFGNSVLGRSLPENGAYVRQGTSPDEAAKADEEIAAYNEEPAAQRRQAQVLRNLDNGEPPTGVVSWKPAQSCEDIRRRWHTAPSGLYYIFYYDSVDGATSYVWRVRAYDMISSERCTAPSRGHRPIRRIRRIANGIGHGRIRRLAYEVLGHACLYLFHDHVLIDILIDLE